MHLSTFIVALATAGSHTLGALALPTIDHIELGEKSGSNGLDANQSLVNRASIFDLCFKGYNPPPPIRTDDLSPYINIEAASAADPTVWRQATGNRHVVYQAWTTDASGTFEGHFRARFHLLFHVMGEQFRWTFSWRSGGNEGCVRGGVMKAGSDTVAVDLNIDSSAQYFFTIERI